MVALCLCLALACSAAADDTLYDLVGHLHPEERAAVTLFGDTFPFTASTLSEADGRFRFQKLRPGAYTVSVLIPERGEARQTIEVGPSLADGHGRVVRDINFKPGDFVLLDTLRRRDTVSTSQLAIPAKAERDYEQAQKDLTRHDAAAATRRLEEAVALAPQFADAWNELGTIAYQTQKWARAEECFREALKQDPRAFEPLVNLGGVLVTVHRAVEAWEYNAMAATLRPNDALAQSQLGMNYFELGDLDLSLKHLERARAIDPAHFSHPQLILAEIHLRRGEKPAAAEVLEEFLRYHPDWPQAAKMREAIQELRK
ncbi:MAG TPA: tetratricopeptide repeat protein [Verrucomicrobiae bacterium]|nr:tetratricopeptide repeat protein [Verrucomicrobiae bacterium]